MRGSDDRQAAGANETAERESLRVIFFLLAMAYCARCGDENRSECASNLMGKQPAPIGSDQQHVAAVEETGDRGGRWKEANESTMTEPKTEEKKSLPRRDLAHIRAGYKTGRRKLYDRFERLIA